MTWDEQDRFSKSKKNAVLKWLKDHLKNSSLPAENAPICVADVADLESAIKYLESRWLKQSSASDSSAENQKAESKAE